MCDVDVLCACCSSRVGRPELVSRPGIAFIVRVCKPFLVIGLIATIGRIVRWCKVVFATSVFLFDSVVEFFLFPVFFIRLLFSFLAQLSNGILLHQTIIQCQPPFVFYWMVNPCIGLVGTAKFMK